MCNKKFIFLAVFLITTTCNLSSEKYAVSKDDTRISYLTEGKGKTSIVFVHGWLGDKNGWEKQISELSKNYYVVALDLAGFGKSGKNRKHWTMEAFGQDILAVLNQLKIKNAILVGHSMGFAAVLEAAAQSSDRIIGLVTVDVMQNVEQKFSTKDIEYEIEKRRPFINKQIKENPIFRNDEAIWIETLREYFKWRSYKLCNVLTQLDMPLISINSDKIFTDKSKVHKYKQDFDIKIVKGVGHGVMIDAPQKFKQLLTEIIIDFISSKEN
jgi:pimeloyl-ACP methyl ester carboxylesterase